MQWYYAESGKQQGPVEFEQLLILVRDGRLKPDDLVWNAAMGSQWAKAATVAGLFETQPPGLPDEAATPLEWSDSLTFKGPTHNRDLMAQARTALDGNWGTAIAGLLVFVLIMIVLSVIPILGSVISFVISGPLTVGWVLFVLNLSRREPAEIGQIFAGFKLFGNAFIAYLLIMLLVVAWSLPAVAVIMVMGFMAIKGALMQDMASLNSMLFLIPLVFVATIPAVIAQFRYSQTYFILNDFPGVGPLDAIRRSTQMMKGNKWKLFCLQCRFIGWGLLCILTLGIGFIWLGPYIAVSTAAFYDDVVASSSQ